VADLCVCRHEERAHYPLSSERACMRDCACGTYRRSPLSAFRGPAVVMSREEAAGWLGSIGYVVEACRVYGSRTGRRRLRARLRTIRLYAREAVARARACLMRGQREEAVLHYLAARILRAVRP